MVVVATGLSRSALPRSEVWPATQMESSRIGVHTLVPSDAMQIEKELEAKANCREPTLHMLIGTIGYLGVCKTDGDQWDFAAAIDPDQVRRFGSIAACVRSILKENGLTNTAFLEQSSWQSTPHLTRTSDCVAMNGVFLLGDAMGYVEPFTGEGMSWALRSGILAARLAIESGTKWSEAIEQRWERIWKEAIGEHRAACSGLARFVRHPRLLQAGLAICPWVPGIAQRLVNSVADRSCASLPKTISGALLDPVTVSRLEPSWQGSEG